jgi:enoyl-[acyl-carrier protein] reductase I
MAGAMAGLHAAVFGFASTRSLAWGIAGAWHAAGASVTIGIQSERFRGALEAATRAWPAPPHVVTCDVCDDASLDAAFAAIAGRSGGALHALAHSVAFAPAAAMRAPLLRTSRADFAAAHDASAYSLLALAARAEPLLAAASPRGSVLALSYLGAARAAPSYRVMGAAKASLEACARGLAAELGPRGIRVNVLSVGPVPTLAARGIADFQALSEAAAARAPLQRGVTLEEVGRAAVFLSTASGVTGQTLYVDAGLSAVV